MFPFLTSGPGPEDLLRVTSPASHSSSSASYSLWPLPAPASGGVSSRSSRPPLTTKRQSENLNLKKVQLFILTETNGSLPLPIITVRHAPPFSCVLYSLLQIILCNIPPCASLLLTLCLRPREPVLSSSLLEYLNEVVRPEVES